MTNSSQPYLPPLYFEGDRSSRSLENSSENNSPELPSEILSQCLTYANWGDLAKLSCVQKSWSYMLMDAASHSVDSQWELAQALLEGKDGLAKNPQKAFRLFMELTNVLTDDEKKPQKTCDNKECFAPAMKKIADCYFNGNGVEQNSNIGLAWLQASFELGEDVDAAHETAIIYEFGRNGVQVDVVAAAQWFEKSAERGHAEAMTELGLCYELGCGVELNDETALDWYTKAAHLGCVTAKFSVGEAFEEARGVNQSDEEACLWYYRAAVMGDEDSKIALRRLYDIARIVCPGVSAVLNE